jgi:crotonobetainyl-CoA:carnitine CoA-transferase CaiB-like acyl-CoA transferase
MTSSGADGILAGVKVIDCATYVAGPAAATIMSDFGAEVIKIERPPDGDLWRTFPQVPGYPQSDLSYTWILTNRNKRSIGLDLSKDGGRDVLMRLVRDADVFVTNYQPSLLRTFRLQWEDLLAINPRLVFALVTGYGERGPEADSPSFDVLAYWARSGLMTSVTGLDGTPAGPRPAIGDQPTAAILFGAIMLGLYRRDRTGRGSKVSTSLMASGAWANAVELQAKLCGAEFPQRKPGGNPPNPLIASYASRDGRPMLIIAMDSEREFPRICAAIDAQELAQNPLFATTESRKSNAAELYAILQSQFERETLAHWRGKFAEYDIKWSSMPTLDEAAWDPQMRACGAIVGMEHSDSGPLETVDSPIQTTDSAKTRPQMPPTMGAHTRAILKEAGYTEQQIEALIVSGVAV